MEEENNKRSGISTKKVKSSSGEFELITHRDRNSTFEPEIVTKRQVVLDDDHCEKILFPYDKWMIYNDI